jgi:hypothetical protein
MILGHKEEPAEGKAEHTMQMTSVEMTEVKRFNRNMSVMLYPCIST